MYLLNQLRDRAAEIIEPAGRFISRSGIGPNAITCMGLVFGIVSAVFFGIGNQPLAGLMLLIGGVFDVLDGAVARASGRETKFGGFLDSTIDRYVDLLLFSGVIFGFLSGKIPEAGFMTGWGWALGIVALSGSFMVSYVRARAESAGSGKMDVGVMERAERLIVLGIGALLSLTDYAVLIIAVLSHLTVIQRIVVAKKRLP